ncbi:MAG TPA: glycosyltransferase family 2 protein [Butyricimonas virosa]|jgi:GT2 family glycosyltransferase|uniref:Glycosyltransferase family 2 protein n=1 Tax=Butyricimonas virosa TaxID=544645 RepID=A0A415QC96_9BACT|nr:MULTISPECIES: glycosyltransferase family 2 protein [Butyricimonas]RHM39648.1 glycosyltransferase family 2 protein [Butyricimonas virosa]HAM85089.1 glycosyl transferase family 2 [Butyricimonas sp.]HCH89769.1 glycosyl transferase family 2 [Butyricimonas sp.]HJF70827.1 glycosyltransferase family 2 protein [Butyricimonas virosa]
MAKRVAIIILNWNGEKLLREFLPSVVKNTNADLGRVVVVDNHSTDGSWICLEQEFPDVERVLFEENFGFAGGYNRAIEMIEVEYVVLLNSDVEVAPGWLEPLVAVLDRDEKVAAVQPKILAYRDKNKFEYAGAAGGYIDYLGFPFCRGRVMDTTEQDYGQYDDEVDVFWATGASLCIRRDVYRVAGGLDEAFFAHMEEIDLCWRLKNGGYTLKVVPSSVVYHLGGGSLPMNHPRKLFLNYRNNLLMLHKNLCAKQRKKIFFARVLLDTMAGGLFLLKGQWSNTRSVIRAYKAFREMRKVYPVPERSVSLSGIYPRSIVLDYFLRGKKKFSDLNFK